MKSFDMNQHDDKAHSENISELIPSDIFQNKKTKEERQRFLHRDRFTEKKRKAIYIHKGASRKVLVPEEATPKLLSNLFQVRTVDILKSMIKLGLHPKSSTEVMDKDIVDLIASEYNIVPFRRELYEEMDIHRRIQPTDTSKYRKRPPIVTIMGHINHGKTSLLDAFRNSHIVDQEAGGITQRIGAFQATLSSGSVITFLDTPGHQAFSGMRSRGSRVTDIVILVIAADSGIQEQTIEAIQLIQEANVPVIVAINKCDKNDANPARVKQQLLEYGIICEEFGGATQAVNISAIKKEGLVDLEDAIMLQAESMDLRTDTEGPAEAIVLEAKRDKGFGLVCTIIVQCGTLRVGDSFVAGITYGKVRLLRSYSGTLMDWAGPSSAVELVGFKALPEPGDEVIVTESEKRAKAISEFRLRNRLNSRGVLLKNERLESQKSSQQEALPKEDELKKQSETKRTSKNLCIILKADLGGSLEALFKEFTLIPQDEVSINVILSGVGEISESDLSLAQTSNAVIFGFNVPMTSKMILLARHMKVIVHRYNVIYQLVDQIKELLTGMLDPRIEINVLGSALVEEIFPVEIRKKITNVAGCRIISGTVTRKGPIRILRKDQVIYQGKIDSLRHHKNPVSMAHMDSECGIIIEQFTDIQLGDLIQSIQTKKVPRKLGEPM